MKVGDLLCWKSQFVRAYPDETPMVVIEVYSGLNHDVRVVRPPSGWTDWISVDELFLVSSAIY